MPQAGEQVDLEFDVQTQIINALLNSDVAKDTYPEGAEASYSDILERDLRFYISGKAGQNDRVTLRCSELAADNLLCTLEFYSEEAIEFGQVLESSLQINGEVSLPAKGSKNREISVSDVKINIAG